jgi:hypothetical protein
MAIIQDREKSITEIVVSHHYRNNEVCLHDNRFYFPKKKICIVVPALHMTAACETSL